MCFGLWVSFSDFLTLTLTLLALQVHFCCVSYDFDFLPHVRPCSSLVMSTLSITFRIQCIYINTITIICVETL